MFGFENKYPLGPDEILFVDLMGRASIDTGRAHRQTWCFPIDPLGGNAARAIQRADEEHLHGERVIPTSSMNPGWAR